MVDRLVVQSLAPSTMRNAVLPLRTIFGRAVAHSEVVQNPTFRLVDAGFIRVERAEISARA